MGNSGAFVPVFPLLPAVVNRNLPDIPPDSHLHPAKPAAVSCLNAAKLASTAATVFVIGGEQIYCQAMAVADRLEITEVDLEPEGDAWFPEIAAVDWKKAARTEGAGFVFVTYRRRAA